MSRNDLKTLNQIKAIVLNNIRINHRCQLFWKETAMTAFIFIIAVAEIEPQKNLAAPYNAKLIL
jgi:hypothetical protein